MGFQLKNGDTVLAESEAPILYDDTQRAWRAPSALFVDAAKAFSMVFVATEAQFIAAVTDATQARLDAFARTRNYDGILSACTYATSTVPKFKAEGQCCVNARDTTWAALYELMADVKAGKRPMPGSVAEVMDLLPGLSWPL